MSATKATRARTPLASIAIAGIVGVVIWKWIARENGNAASLTARHDEIATSSRAASSVTEAVATSPTDGALAAERTTETKSSPARPDAPVTWVEGVIKLFEPAPLPPPPWPDDIPPNLPDVEVDAARLNGSFLPEFFDGPDDSELPDEPTLAPADDPHRVHVVAGKFRFDARGATAMLVRGLELDRRLAEVEGGVELSVDTPASVRAHWSADVLLHVVDAKTKAELDGVTIAARPFFFSAANDVGVPRLDVMVAGKSPLHASWKGRVAAIDSGLIWIGATGHAWSPRNWDLPAGSTVTVELDAGGALVVEVKGEDASGDERPIERRPRVRLRDVGGKSSAAAVRAREREPALRRFYDHEERPKEPDDWLVFDALASDEPMEFDGLPAGEFVASLEVGDDPQTPQVLDHATVKLVAGTTQHVTLSLRPDALVKPVDVEGSLYVPPSWGRDHGFVVEFIPQGLLGGTRSDHCFVAVKAMEPVAGNDGWYRWRIGPVSPATYVVREPRAPFETRFDVGSAGRHDVVLELPEPASLVVRLVDQATSEPIEIKTLVWYSAVEENHNSVAMQILSWDPSQKALVGAVASGTGHFDGASVEYALIRDENAEPDEKAWALPYTVHPGRNEITLTVWRRCGVDLRFEPAAVAKSAGAAGGSIGVVRLRWTRLDTGDTEESERMCVTTDVVDATPFHRASLSWIALPAPGRYRFEFPDRPRLASFEIDVPAREFVKHTVTK